MTERRKFSRVVYQTDVIILHNGTSLNGALIDLSLNGLLVELDDEYHFELNTQMNVRFSLNESDIHIIAECELIQRTNNILRLCIQFIDIDSISHLKRLIELNVGNSDMLLRQLSELTTLT